MTAFAALQKQTRAPVMTLLVPPSVFADEWDGKPSEDVALGLRLLSESDIQSARRIATDTAVKEYAADGEVVDPEAYLEALNDGLVREAIARAICDPNDVTQPHPLLPYAADLVQYAFTSEGARFIWDELHRLTLERSPLVRPITDDEASALASLLARGVLAYLSPSRALTARKLLAAVLDDCSDVAHQLGDEGAPAADAGEATYLVKG